MLFVGASWGANLPVTKVMLGHFDLMPMVGDAHGGGDRGAGGAALGWSRAAYGLAHRSGARPLPPARPDDGGFFACYALGIHFSNPITAAAVSVAGPLVSAATVRLVTGARFDPGFGVALALTVLGGADPGRRAACSAAAR